MSFCSYFAGGALAEGILRVSQNSLNILKEGLVEGPFIGTASEEPLSLLSNDDPGYETVRQVGGILKATSQRPTSINESSEHDPNYEALLPNATVSGSSVGVKSSRFGDDEEEDGYSKIRPAGGGVVGRTKQSSVGSDNDGYSSIRNIPNETITARIDVADEDDEDGVDVELESTEATEPSYSRIGAVGASTVHGYASIDEAKKDRLEGYSTIAESSTLMTSSISGATTNSTVSPVSPINYFPVTSVGETTTSYSSPSSELSSSELNLNRNSLLLMTTSSEGNNYESLTSEDPNYETVRHLRITENPYEVLENELGTPGAAGEAITLMGICFESDRSEENGEEDRRVRGTDLKKVSDSPEVGDYFQV